MTHIPLKQTRHCILSVDTHISHSQTDVTLSYHTVDDRKRNAIHILPSNTTLNTSPAPNTRLFLTVTVLPFSFLSRTHRLNPLFHSSLRWTTPRPSPPTPQPPVALSFPVGKAFNPRFALPPLGSATMITSHYVSPAFPLSIKNLLVQFSSACTTAFPFLLPSSWAFNTLSQWRVPSSPFLVSLSAVVIIISTLTPTPKPT